jgi:hypothetical protein
MRRLLFVMLVPLLLLQVCVQASPPEPQHSGIAAQEEQGDAILTYLRQLWHRWDAADGSSQRSADGLKRPQATTLVRSDNKGDLGAMPEGTATARGPSRNDDNGQPLEPVRFEPVEPLPRDVPVLESDGFERPLPPADESSAPMRKAAIEPAETVRSEPKPRKATVVPAGATRKPQTPPRSATPNPARKPHPVAAQPATPRKIAAEPAETRKKSVGLRGGRAARGQRMAGTLNSELGRRGADSEARRIPALPEPMFPAFE